MADFYKEVKSRAEQLFHMADREEKSFVTKRDMLVFAFYSFLPQGNVLTSSPVLMQKLADILFLFYNRANITSEEQL